VLPVEPGEAEWLLDTLEELFDFYFVQATKLAAKRVALNGEARRRGQPAQTLTPVPRRETLSAMERPRPRAVASCSIGSASSAG
jgi:hypothetical protein